MVFPGTIHTTGILLLYLFPYLLLCSVGIVGLNVVASKKTEFRPFLGAILLGPILIVLFAILKGLDAFTFSLVYRSYDYIDFGLAICAGIGAWFLIKNITAFLTRGTNDHKALFTLTASLSVVFLSICLGTVPLAFNGQEFYGVQDSTYEHEFAAMTWLDQYGSDYEISTDERSCDIMTPYFDLHCDKTLPWKLKYGKGLENDTILFIEDKWMDVGAQMSPMEPIIIPENTFENIMDENNLVYSTGRSGPHPYVVIVK
jgi:hypothetical protein